MSDKSTQPRLDATKVSPDLYKTMLGLEKYVEGSGLEQKLLDLVKIRASQINGCAYCIVMHTNDARKHGESDESMHLLNAWHEAPIYSARERAALAWTEAVTKISDHHVPDEVYDEARHHFSEKELVDLTAAVIAINAWNRVAIAFRPTLERETRSLMDRRNCPLGRLENWCRGEDSNLRPTHYECVALPAELPRLTFDSAALFISQQRWPQRFATGLLPFCAAALLV